MAVRLDGDGRMVLAFTRSYGGKVPLGYARRVWIDTTELHSIVRRAANEL